MRRSDSLTLVVFQIVPACSVYGRKGRPHFACTRSGTTHHSDVTAPRSAVRHANAPTARHSTSPRNGSYAIRSSGPASTHAVVAALIPPPVDVTISANTAGQT